MASLIPLSAILCMAILLPMTISRSDISFGPVAEGFNTFSSKLQKALSEGSPAHNSIYSPLSISTALMMLYYMTGGETASEILATVMEQSERASFEAVENGLPTLISTVVNGSSTDKARNGKLTTTTLATKMYVSKSMPLREQFRRNIGDKLFSMCENIDFTDSSNALHSINSWVKTATNGMITDLVNSDSVNGDTQAVLLSAIYFKGNWLNKFDPAQTKPRKFYSSEKGKNSTYKVDMMKITKKFVFGHLQGIGAQYVLIPYSNKENSLLIILPNERDGLEKVERALQGKNIFTDILINGELTKLKLIIPKIKYTETINLKEILKKMGISRVFDAQKANFTQGVDSVMPMEVSTVVHKALIEMDESGTRAAAATGIGIMGRSLQIPSKVERFVADHPFLFHIVNREAQVILFSGKYLSPT